MSRGVAYMKTNHNAHFPIVVTAGSNYLDIDAFACMVALAELLQQKGEKAIAYSSAPYNYSVCDFLIEKGQILSALPSEYQNAATKYAIVDVSDPEYIKDSVDIQKVAAVYDHHIGFEEYWQSRIKDNAHIEFIGAAATLIWREWKAAGLEDKISVSSARLLIAAILDNTLNLTASNTTDEDIQCFNELCKRTGVGKEWCALYFRAVQENIEADLKNALFKDLKIVSDNKILPRRVAQLCIWDAERVLGRLDEIRRWFAEGTGDWMINIIDINNRCSYFVCDNEDYQKRIGDLFKIEFNSGVAKTPEAYLRKQMIKKTVCN